MLGYFTNPQIVTEQRNTLVMFYFYVYECTIQCGKKKHEKSNTETHFPDNMLM